MTSTPRSLRSDQVVLGDGIAAAVGDLVWCDVWWRGRWLAGCIERVRTSPTGKPGLEVYEAMISDTRGRTCWWPVKSLAWELGHVERPDCDKWWEKVERRWQHMLEEIFTRHRRIQEVARA